MESTKNNVVVWKQVVLYEIINEAASHAFSKFGIKAEREN